jgi:hypothetical protein
MATVIHLKSLNNPQKIQRRMLSWHKEIVAQLSKMSDSLANQEFKMLSLSNLSFMKSNRPVCSDGQDSNKS